jgi:hypothetical protein
MRMNISLCTFLWVAAAALPLAAQNPNLSGTWLGQSNAAQKWVFDQKDGKIHIKEMDGDRVDADFTCSLDGQECAVKEDGRSEKITMYFNGAKLVEIRERGSETVKQRLTESLVAGHFHRAIPWRVSFTV